MGPRGWSGMETSTFRVLEIPKKCVTLILGGGSSVGRTSACHAEGQGFESLPPLHGQTFSGGARRAAHCFAKAGKYLSGRAYL